MQVKNMMNCHKIVLSIVFACVCSFGVIDLKGNDSSQHDRDTADEYAVYTAAMKDMVGGGGYVVINPTSTHDKPERLDRALNFPVEFSDTITNDLVADFVSKNQASVAIAQKFPKDVNVTLITESEESRFFTNSSKGGWNAFYEKYPGAAGITRLSRVGFNNKRDVAVLYIGNVTNWETGRGAYLLLQKGNGGWKVIAQTRGWIT